MRPSSIATRRFCAVSVGRRPLPSIVALAVLIACVPPALRAEEPVPEPLTLEQALAFAADHPRVKAATTGDAANVLTLPRPQPLYLGCHTLAYSGARDADAARDVAWSPLLNSERAQRLEIMQRFFDVLLADLSFARDNEAMAVAYIQFDRAEARGELGQFSALQIAELQAKYQLIRRQRAAAEAAQRVTRSLLAGALGRPKSLPRDLVTPALGSADADPPELEQVTEQALRNNPQVTKLMQGRSVAEQALVRAALRQRALELLTRLDLLEVIAEQARSESDWRDLKLDESRTMYEFEATSDLGYSMSQQTKARRDERETAFCRHLTQTELNALQGMAP